MLKIFILLSILTTFSFGFLVQMDEDGIEKHINIFHQCNQYHILTPNYRQCLHIIHEVGQQGFLNCRRINHTGSCAEATFGIELIGKDEFSFIDHQILGDQCAKVDPSYKMCIYPRLGHVLDFKNQKIWYDADGTFCALFDSELNSCSEYFDGFIFDSKKGKSFYLGESFKHPEKVIQNGKGTSGIECKEGYEFIKITTQVSDIFYQKYSKIELIGCFLKATATNQLGKGIDNCEEYIHSTTICKKCAMGYSISQDGQQCKKITQNCEVFATYFGEEICSKCKPFYKKDYRECVPLVGCVVVSDIDQSKCIGCSKEYSLQKNNECVKHYTIRHQSTCIAYGKDYKCIKCSDSDNFYPSVVESTWCVQRYKSVNCTQKRDDLDACKNEYCNQGFYYVDSFKYQSAPSSFYQFKQQAIITYNLIDKNDREFQGYCVKRKNTIKFCEKYNPIEDTCLECQKGYQKVYFKVVGYVSYYTCEFLAQPVEKIIIENCLEYDINQQFCKKCQQYYFYDESLNICYLLPGCLYPVTEERSMPNLPQKFTVKDCSVCREGFTMTKQRRCEQKIYENNCLISRCVGRCQQCKRGYVLEHQSKKCVRNIDFPNCQRIGVIPDIESEDSNMKTQSDSQATINISKTKIGCIECNQDYTLFNGACICQSSSCRTIYTCDEKDLCFKQLKGGYKFKNEYSPNILKLTNEYFVFSIKDQEYLIAQCKILNCQICKSETHCYSCEDGYFYNIKEKKCVEICNSTTCVDPQKINYSNTNQSYPCSRYDSFAQCIECPSHSQYLYLSDQQCYQECHFDHLFKLFKLTLLCYSCPQNCELCDIFTSNYGIATCLACHPDTIKVDGQCYEKRKIENDQNKNSQKDKSDDSKENEETQISKTEQSDSDQCSDEGIIEKEKDNDYHQNSSSDQNETDNKKKLEDQDESDNENSVEDNDRQGNQDEQEDLDKSLDIGDQHQQNDQDQFNNENQTEGHDEQTKEDKSIYEDQPRDEDESRGQDQSIDQNQLIDQDQSRNQDKSENENKLQDVDESSDQNSTRNQDGLRDQDEKGNENQSGDQDKSGNEEESHDQGDRDKPDDDKIDNQGQSASTNDEKKSNKCKDKDNYCDDNQPSDQTLNEDKQKSLVSQESNSNSSLNYWLLLVFCIVIFLVIFLFCLLKAYRYFSNKRNMIQFNPISESEDQIASVTIEVNNK